MSVQYCTTVVLSYCTVLYTVEHTILRNEGFAEAGDYVKAINENSMDPSLLRWQEEDTCYYCNNGIVDTCEVVRLVHGTREYELHIDESTRSDRKGRDIFVPVESDRLHFQHPEADHSMRVEHAAGADKKGGAGSCLGKRKKEEAEEEEEKEEPYPLGQVLAAQVANRSNWHITCEVSPFRKMDVVLPPRTQIGRAHV